MNSEFVHVIAYELNKTRTKFADRFNREVDVGNCAQRTPL